VDWQDWRTDRYLRRLEAMNAGADASTSPSSPAPVCAGTGTHYGHRLRPANYAACRARALSDSKLDAETICRQSDENRGDICVYTNENVTLENWTLNNQRLLPNCALSSGGN